MKKINLIFDFDGTIFDSYDSVTDCLYRLLKHFNIESDKKELRELALFHDVNYAINEYCNRYNIKFDDVKEYYKNIKQNFELIKPYPHLIDVLNNEKFNCFIYTHRGASAKTIVDNYNLTNKFIEIVDSTYNLKKKPNGEGVIYLINKYSLIKEDTYYVGDRLLDIECGIDAGIKTIFFDSANLPIDHTKADIVINDLSDLLNIDFK